MCLQTVDLNLKYEDKERAFVGYGYKMVNKEYLNEYEKNKWHLASYGKYDAHKQARKKKKLISSKCGIEYHPGFHIFLNLEDSKNYLYRNSEDLCVKVKFKNVVCFGKDITRHNDGMCVVSDSMKIIKVVK